MLTSSTVNPASASKPENVSKDQGDNVLQSSIPFPFASEPADTLPPNELAEDPGKEPKLGRGHHVAKKPKGHTHACTMYYPYSK